MRIALAVLALAVTTLQAAERDVWVASRRVHKGSAIACADFHVERRKLPEQSNVIGPACDIAPGFVALRELGAGDILHPSDIGAPFAVLAGSHVRVDVESGSVTVSVLATALDDARVGDELDVRLTNPLRTFKTRVVGPGVVTLGAGAL